MTRYLFRRLFSGLLVLFLFVTMMYFGVDFVLPGDYASHFALGLSTVEMQEMRKRYGLDLPVEQRYLIWLSNLLKGDLGLSYSGSPVIDVLEASLPSTLFVLGIGTALAFLFGQWLGKFTAWSKVRPLTGLATFTTILLYTSFPPWLAFLLFYLIGERLGIFVQITAQQRWTPILMAKTDIMAQMLSWLAAIALGLYILNAALRRRWRRPLPGLLFYILLVTGWVGSWYAFGYAGDALDIMRRATLPILAFALLFFGEMTLIMRTAMIDTMHDDYVQTAWAKGLPSRVVRDRHVAHNALLPVVSRLVVSLPYLLAGAAMIEQSLNWAGVGWMLFYAVGMQDVPLMVGVLLVIGVISLGARLGLDILYALLDPRIRAGMQISRRYL